jgi:hypothetical protein
MGAGVISIILPWSPVFGTEVSERLCRIDAFPHKLLARSVNLMIKPVLTKALSSDMDAVRSYYEKE